MDLIPALLIVGASYAGYLLAWRRVRAARGRRRGPDPAAVSAFDYAALERELPGLCEARPELRDRFIEALQRARLADAAAPGPARVESALEALAALRRVREATLDAPGWSGLAAHLEVQRLSFWSLEYAELRARRWLRKALARHPDAPSLHLVRAHLEASLGNAEGAADQLARALYYAKGDPFYARPIVASPAMARLRPALDAQARAVLEAGEPLN
ncbi:MAG TPA: hypothetical protein VN033_04000 [Vulgatibacter sp.]|nr:hypothetical protein [Vulgatibacter sp.]